MDNGIISKETTTPSTTKVLKNFMHARMDPDFLLYTSSEKDDFPRNERGVSNAAYLRTYVRTCFWD